MESIVAPLGSDDIDSGEEALDELLELINKLNERNVSMYNIMYSVMYYMFNVK